MAEEKINVTEKVVARRIFNRTREILANPENIEKIAVGRFPELTGSCTGAQIENIKAEMGKLGYNYALSHSTKQSHLMSKIDREIDYAREGGEPAKVEELYEQHLNLENQFSQIAIDTIVTGLQDGSIPMDFASQSDDEIVNTLIASDGTKEASIESQMLPIREKIDDKVDQIVFGPAPTEAQ